MQTEQVAVVHLDVHEQDVAELREAARTMDREGANVARLAALERRYVATGRWTFTCRPGGWMRAVCSDGRTVYMRISTTNWEIQEVHLIAPSRTTSTSRAWRDIPFKAAESVARRPEAGRVLSVETAEGIPQWSTSLEAYFGPSPDRGDVPVRDQPAPIRRTFGSRKPLSVEFLKSVADNYLWLVDQGLSPAAEIATRTGYPVRTVQGWVAAARQRGFLPPAVGAVAG